MKKAYRYFVFVVMIPFMISVYVCFFCWVIGFTIAWPFSRLGGVSTRYWSAIREVHMYIVKTMFATNAL